MVGFESKETSSDLDLGPNPTRAILVSNAE